MKWFHDRFDRAEVAIGHEMVSNADDDKPLVIREATAAVAAGHVGHHLGDSTLWLLSSSSRARHRLDSFRGSAAFRVGPADSF